jgi:phosphonate transport system substrate-binding protein
MNGRRIATVLLGALALAVLPIVIAGRPSGAQEPEGETIVVAMVPERNVFEQMKRFRPLQDYLSLSTGFTYRFAVMSSYYDAFIALSNGKAQAAILGSAAAFLAVEQGRGEIIGRPLWKNGTATYRAIIIARKDAGISSVGDLKGKRYAFVNSLSTGGWIFDRWALSQRGIKTLAGFLGMHIIAGSHDVVVEAVYRGHVDAGGCKDLVWERKRKEFPDLTEKVVVIARSQALPESSLIVSHSMPAPQQALLRDTLFAMHTKQDGQQALEEMGMTKFIPAAKGEFDYLRGLFRDLGLDPKKYDDLFPPAP